MGRVLSNNILKHYDGLKVSNKVREVFDLIDYLENTVDDFEYPTITSSCQVRYEQFVKGVSSSKLENFVLDKIMFELRGNDYKRKLLMTKFTIALRKLSNIEMTVFKLSVYEGMEIYDICDHIHFGYTRAREIKKSAFVKFLMALNLDSECIKGGDAKMVNAYFDMKTTGI